MSAAPVIRAATPADAPALLAIYAPHVERVATSFEEVPPTAEEFAARIERCLASHAWLVAECDGVIAGYAYGSPHRDRAAYRWSVEVSAYVHADFHRRGIARALYGRLFDDLAARGYCQAYAGITLPNEASVGLHRALGFAPIGVFPRVGWKKGAWHDVMWLHRELLAGAPPDAAAR